MTKKNELNAVPIEDQALARKLEFAILSVLIHYNGCYEETLLDWYVALRLNLPQLTDPYQLRDAFKDLAAADIVELDRPGFCDDEPFITTLTRIGLVHWNTIRIQPWQISAYNQAGIVPSTFHQNRNVN